MTRRRGLLIGAVVVGLLLLLFAWIGIRAILARDHLLKARADVTRLQATLTSGQLDDLPAEMAALQREARAARGLTSDVLWGAVSKVPWLGGSLDTAHDVAQVVDQVANQVLPPLVHATDTISPRTLRQPGGTIDLGRLAASVPDLQASSKALESARSRLAKTSHSGVVGPVATAQRTLSRSLTSLAGSLDTAYRAARIGPAMLGSTGPRTYLMIFQTPAESRGTGGLAGSFAVVRFDNGKLTTERQGSDSELRDSSTPVVDLGPDFNSRYGQAGSVSEWTAANWTPNFPWAAEIWAKLWQRQSSQRVDGVIAVDPIALGYLLGVTGPVKLSDGEVITSANAASWSMSDSYRRYASNNVLRKKLSVELSKQVLQQLSAQQTDLTALLKAVGRAAGERRVLMWSAHPAEQALLSGTPLAGELSAASGPFADLVLRNGAGDKLDYYVNRSLNYRVLSCTSKTRQVQISFTLTNTAPTAGLPKIVTNRLDGLAVPVGEDRIYADLFMAAGAVLSSWNLDGGSIPARLSIEKGHSVAEFDLELPPGGVSRTVTARVREPASKSPVVIPVQPLVRPLRVTSSNHC